MNKKIIFLDVDGTLTLPTGEDSLIKLKMQYHKQEIMDIMFFYVQEEIRQVYVHYYLLGLMVRFVVLEVILKLLVKKFMSLV